MPYSSLSSHCWITKHPIIGHHRELQEVEFVIQWDDKIIPVEVKAEENISGNSLSEYNKKYAPPYRMRFSMLNLQYNSGLLSSPSPLAGWIDKWMPMINNQ